MYSSLAIKLFESSNSQDAAILIEEFITKLRGKRPSLDEFKVAFREVVYTNSNSKQKNLTRYILEKNSVYNSYKYPVDYEELTIEHLCPQTKIDESSWSESSVGCLGNLIFLDQKTNEKLATKNFTEKKEILIKEGCSVPDFILKTEEWTPTKVFENADLMAEVAYNNIWEI